ncbi:BCD family MFS transporter [Acuticoccus kandeliae]|uniref:BCD family MFS transporter n=1 Tax=Acuticoccus kandeliae TaxID=2073160 RepID=UPI001FEC5838|nr:BCD family MFS transporter [Acuticoccus kandeliae]
MSASAPARGLSYVGIVRLGLVQAGLGAIVILTTSTMNRVMIVEYALPAMLPGALVAYHYAVQVLRPRFGHGADISRRRTPWVIGGMATLAAGGILAAVATAWMATDTAAGIALAIIAFSLVGAGVAAAGTALLALLAVSVEPVRRGAAATIVWLMMIAGFAVTAGIAGGYLDPFSPARLVTVTAVVAAIALAVTLLALAGLERPHAVSLAAEPAKPPFREALREVWADGEARRFTLFVFMSMLAYNLQDLILEPFGGTVFGMSPGETTQLAGLQHAGVLVGMLIVAFAATWIGRGRASALKTWTVGGCIASAAAFVGLIAAGHAGPAWPLSPFVFFLGLANGTFAVAAIGTMMSLAGSGRVAGEGVRLGVWGAAQAFAFGIGGFLGTAAIDATRAIFADPATAYSIVFSVEAITFLFAARLAAGVARRAPAEPAPPLAAPALAR